MNDYEAIRRTIALYGQLLDDKRFDVWSELFTDDARFVARTMRLQGRDQIREQIAAALGPSPSFTKHHQGSPVIDLADGATTASAWTDLVTFTNADGAIATVTTGRYHDELRKGADGRWRFAHRELVLSGAAVPDGLRLPPVC